MKTISHQSLSRFKLGHGGWKEVRGIPTKGEGDSPTKGEVRAQGTSTKGRQPHEGRVKGEWVPPRRLKRDREKKSPALRLFRRTFCQLHLFFFSLPFFSDRHRTIIFERCNDWRDIFTKLEWSSHPQSKIMYCILPGKKTVWSKTIQNSTQVIFEWNTIHPEYVGSVTGFRLYA